MYAKRLWSKAILSFLQTTFFFFLEPVDIWTGSKCLRYQPKLWEPRKVSEPPVGVNILPILVIKDNMHEFQSPQVKHSIVIFDCSLSCPTSLPAANPGGSASTIGQNPTTTPHLYSHHLGPRHHVLSWTLQPPGQSSCVHPGPLPSALSTAARIFIQKHQWG